ncbi:hypothetical protein RSSM_05341 [Rhodopirellula sallentina SM41]|uniref:Uncharacterized protein n=1 Tax=Rhodopirellula sallentina SM41 TaxID=1263870 RepID=M5TVL0_9BACT|nr:hypothetical protein RSSM_05341 [Rhodopirellula sallentina SM41]
MSVEAAKRFRMLPPNNAGDWYAGPNGAMFRQFATPMPEATSRSS